MLWITKRKALSKCILLLLLLVVQKVDNAIHQAYPPTPLMNYYSKFESVGSCTYQIISAFLHMYHLSFPEFDVNVF